MKSEKIILMIVIMLATVNPMHAGIASGISSLLKVIGVVLLRTDQGMCVYQKDETGNEINKVNYCATIGLYLDRFAKCAAIYYYLKSKCLNNAVRIVNSAIQGEGICFHDGDGVIRSVKNMSLVQCLRKELPQPPRLEVPMVDE